MTGYALTPRYPDTRLRRLRRQPWLRDLVREVTLTPADLIWPIFVRPGEAAEEPVASLPGVNRLSVDRAVEAARHAAGLGIPAIALFPAIDPALKTPDGAEALNPDTLVCQAVRAVKAAVPSIGIVCDVALDPYTSHGHDGLLDDQNRIMNDPSVEVLVAQGRVLAEAGADILAPSDMMDGRIQALRHALDGDGAQDVAIMSYAAKFASAFYGPFRDAVGSGGVLIGDKKTYQMDPANGREALREVSMDISEGADMVMVKPGLPYLDVVADVARTTGLPTFAYQVSGEYAMLKAAAANGWLDYDRCIVEVLMGFKRAGAAGVLTYAALEICDLLARA